MSDIMQGPPPAAPGEGSKLDSIRSVGNPTDAAMFAQQSGGQIPTIEQFVTNILKVPGGVRAPVTELAKALKSQAQNASPLGKVQSMAGQGQPTPAPMSEMKPPGPSAMGRMGQGGPGGQPGIEELANRLGR